jgi:hypothetical protein
MIIKLAERQAVGCVHTETEEMAVLKGTCNSNVSLWVQYDFI